MYIKYRYFFPYCIYSVFVTNIIKVVVVRFNVTFTKWHEATGGKLLLKEHYDLQVVSLVFN